MPVMSDLKTPPSRGRLPNWLRKRLHVGSENIAAVRELIDELGLATVCSSAQCPNMGECFDRRTATFMILGETCTRSCAFCAVDKTCAPEPLRPDEPEAVADACARLALRHVVITSVTRDDLTDGGADQFVRVIRAVRARRPHAVIEVLTPDFRGNVEAIATVIDAGPDVFNHNMETIERLYDSVRPQANYGQSLQVLRDAKDRGRSKNPSVHTKSGLMVGLGETFDEIIETLKDLRSVDCDLLTIGQYLAPSPRHHPVVRYVEPAEFEEMQAQARALGFRAVAAGPFVRSSYQAGSLFEGRDSSE